MAKPTTQAMREQAQAKPEAVLLCAPRRVLLIVTISIMLAEVAIMFLFDLLPPLPPLLENIADGALLGIVLSPILYLFLFRPLRRHAAALGLAEKSLRRQNEELAESNRRLLAAQEELVRKEKLALLGQVADTVGHELRNPLGVMSNAVYFLQSVLADADETTREYLGIIKDEIADAERIVSDLLDAVRTKPPQPESVALAGLLRQVLRKCDIPPAVSVRLEIPEALPALRIDPGQMHQVFWNLIVNAVEAMPDGGTLDIAAVEDPAAKTVTVGFKDSGRGIPLEDRAKLFQPMFTTKARRVGLGLVVVKNLTQANGGSVGMESETGRGSTFFVTLPSGS